MALYSYTNDITTAQPLAGAALDRRTVYVFWKGQNISSVRFYCCKGISGNAQGEAHTILGATDSTAPFSVAIDMSQYSTEGQRELYVDYRTSAGVWIEDNFTNFTITPPATTQTPTTHTATVSWTIPTTRTDGSALAASDINHFEIYVYNQTSGAVNVTEVGGTITQWSVTLSSGNYSFGVLTVDDQGLASSMSALESLTIP